MHTEPERSRSIVDDVLAELEKLVSPANRAEYEAMLRPQLEMAQRQFGDVVLRPVLSDVRRAVEAIARNDVATALVIAERYGVRAQLAAQLDGRGN